MLKYLIKKYNPNIIVIINGSSESKIVQDFCAMILSLKSKVESMDGEISSLKLFIILLKMLFNSSNLPKTLILRMDLYTWIKYSANKYAFSPKAWILSPLKLGAITQLKQCIQKLPISSSIVVNRDDPAFEKITSKVKTGICSYGVIDEDSDIHADEVKILEKDGGQGLHFKMFYHGTMTPVFVKGVKDETMIHPILASAACATLYEFTPLEIAQGFEQY